jgi:hypothetical protein
MNRLGVLSKTEGRLVEIVNRRCGRGYVYDFDVTQEFRDIYERQKHATLERRLRDLRAKALIIGGSCLVKINGKMETRTRYRKARRK